MKGRVRDRGACSYKQADRSKGSSALLSSRRRRQPGGSKFKVQGFKVKLATNIGGSKRSSRSTREMFQWFQYRLFKGVQWLDRLLNRRIQRNG
jgi:hypothetical protein